jgi:CheY-like chemotaxis protein
MKVVPPKPSGLPHTVQEAHARVPLDVIGWALRRLYDGLLAEGIPEHLASLVQRLEHLDPHRLSVRHRRIALLVEDEAQLCELAVAVLAETGLEVMTCESAEAALAIMQTRGGDVAFVFADIRLAGVMDGVDLARSIVTLWPKARVVLTSGAAEERITNLPEGVAFLPKPWRGREVLVEVERAISKPNPAVR